MKAIAKRTFSFNGGLIRSGQEIDMPEAWIKDHHRFVDVKEEKAVAETKELKPKRKTKVKNVPIQD